MSKKHTAMLLEPMFTDALAVCMKNKKINTAQLARVLDVDRKTLINWKLGYVAPNIKMLLRICKFFSTTPNQMLGYEKLQEGKDEQSKAV